MLDHWRLIKPTSNVWRLREMPCSTSNRVFKSTIADSSIIGDTLGIAADGPVFAATTEPVMSLVSNFVVLVPSMSMALRNPTILVLKVHLFRFSWNNDDDYCTGEDCVQCDYFRSAAFYLLVAASVSVIFSQIIISISTDCGCCSGRNSSSSSQILSIFTFVFSWLSCIAAIIVYLIGGAKQYGVQFPESGRVSSLRSIWVDNTNCYKVKPGIFGAAAAFSFGAASLGIITYLISISKNNRREISGTAEFQNHGNSPDHMDRPTDIAVALPDVPATPVRRFLTVERYQIPSEPRRIPVMVQA